MWLPRAGLLLALGAAAARVHADDDTAAQIQASSDASSRAPTRGHLKREDAYLKATCDGSGAWGYMYCRAADWSAWLFSSGQRAFSRLPGGDRLGTDEESRRLNWGSTSGMRFATRSYEPMHK